MKSRSWFYIFFEFSAGLILMVGLLNYIVDPFSITQNNLLDIPVKLISDDRTEKVTVINNIENMDNVLLGSSRVYLMNPLMLSRYVGGVTYNLGVGTAQVEDHLGFLLHLEKINKFPEVIVIGIDFYSFNAALETNKYFIRNKTINFLNKNDNGAQYIGELVSWDATRASIKTLKNFLGEKKQNKRFDINGASGNASKVFEYFPVGDNGADIYAKARQRIDSDFIFNPPYMRVSEKRLDYLKQIVALAEQQGADLKIFITPLYARLLDDIHADKMLGKRVDEFKQALAGITPYYDFLTYNTVTRKAAFFGDPSHMKTSTGNLVLARLYDDKDVDVPHDFGVFIELQSKGKSN